MLQEKTYNYSIYKILLFSLTSFLINEVFSINSIGVFFSFFLFLVLSVFILKYERKEIFFIFLFVSILIDEFPRDVLLDYGDYIFFTIKTVKIGPVNLFLLLSVLLFFRLFFAAGGAYINIFALLTFFLYFFVSCVDYLFNDVFNTGLYVTNSKILLFFFIGAYIGNFYSKKYSFYYLIEEFFKFLKILSMVISLRVLFNIIKELYLGNYMVFDLGAEPLYVLCALLYFYNYRWPLINYLGFFTTSRAEIVFLVFSILIGKIINFKKINIANIFLVIGFLYSAYLIINFYIPFLFDFFLWKISEIEVFGGEASGSSIVRQYELINIGCDMTHNLFRMIFGGGLGATYNFDCMPLPGFIELDEKSFSADQINANNFYGVHSTPAAIFLRFGLLGFISLVFIISISVISVVKSKFEITKKYSIILLFLFLFYYLHSQVHAQMIFGYIFSICLKNFTSKRDD